MSREYLENIKSENRLERIRLIQTSDPVIGGQPSDNENEFTSNTPLLDLACTMKYAVDEIEKNKTGADTDISAIEKSLNTKAEKSEVESELKLKADKTDVERDLKLKADQSAMTNELAKKIDKAAITHENGTAKDKVASQFLVSEIYRAIIEAIEVPVDKIFVFESAVPPKGFIERKGQKIDEVTMPKLYARYGANMPDDRDRVLRMTGSSAGSVGSTQEDAMPKISGRLYDVYVGQNTSAGGAIYQTENLGQIYTSTDGRYAWANSYGLDSARVFNRIADEVRVKSRIVIFCNKIQ